MKSFPTTETTFLFPGPAGNIEVLASPADEAKQKNAVAIICHPHPLFGGTMRNKVVTMLANTCHDLGLSTVRFNFRGVGKSEGTHDNGIGETEDLLALVKWVREIFPDAALWLAGFSFGAFIATRAALRTKAEQLVTVAPQVSRLAEENLANFTTPWVLIQGEQDEVVSPDAVFTWIETLPHKPLVIRMPGAGHFFHGQLLELRKKLEEVLNQRHIL